MSKGVGVFIGLESSGRPVQRVICPVLLHNGRNAMSYVQVLTGGQSKK
jgi:hypothetical protein